MAILEEEVRISIAGGNKSYYENKGYIIPKYIDKQGRLKVKRGTEILVKINDLPEKCNKKVTKVCDDCGKRVLNQPYCVILRHREESDGKDRCLKCGRIQGGITKKDNIKYENSLEYWTKTNNKEYLLNEFSDKNNKKPSEISYGTTDVYLWDCSECNSEYTMSVNNRTNGNCNCSYCAGLKVNHTNSLATTHPEIAKLLFDPEDGHRYTKGSHKKVDWKCPDCGNEIKNKAIGRIAYEGLSCPKCSDGFKYPEKIMYNVLDQLNIEFETQKTFDWSEGKRYDFYIPSLSCIIETHGEQHYRHTGFHRTAEEEKENDALKEKLALSNGMENYIIIDCRDSNINYIKNNILNSELNNMFDLSSIHWGKCHEFALVTIVKMACDYWNKGIKNTNEIGEILKLSRSTILRYLRKGADIGWCEYNPKEVMIEKGITIGKKNKKQIVQLTMDGEFIKIWDSMNEAGENLGMNHRNISAVCTGKRKSTGGFLWIYKEDYEKNNSAVRPYEVKKRTKPVVQLTLNNEFLKEWDSITEAGGILSISFGNITSVCKGAYKSAGGFKWMYLSEYNEIYKETLNK